MVMDQENALLHLQLKNTLQLELIQIQVGGLIN
jgi:hypothetical protein